MRKSVGICVLMMTLAVVLSACSRGDGGMSRGEELALEIRGEYLAMGSCTAQAKVQADYGERVYRYEMTLSWSPEETVLTLTSPQTVAGLTARAAGEESFLSYDGLVLETGPLDQEGLSPVSALPALMQAARSGFITGCGLEELGELETVRVSCGDPEGEPGQGREVELWFDTDTHALVRGEIRVDGRQVIACAFSDFTREEKG